MQNVDIRITATSKNVRLWEIAEEMGITDSSFSRKLRRELDPMTKARILEIIDYLSKKEAWQGGNRCANTAKKA